MSRNYRKQPDNLDSMYNDEIEERKQHKRENNAYDGGVAPGIVYNVFNIVVSKTKKKNWR